VQQINLKHLDSSPGVFDRGFQIKEDDILYCLEFVCDVLNKTDAVKFSFKPIRKKLNEFYATALDRKTLKYIPVDFCQTFNLFKKVEEVIFIVNNKS
jgi:hypothetical protein